MPALGFFTTMAGLALSLAGFASLIAWLRDDQTRWDVINLWRVKTIVRQALTILFIALLLHPVHALSGDDRTTVRVGAAVLALFTLSEMARNRRRDPAIWPVANFWRLSMAVSCAYVALHVAAFGLASTGLMQLGFLLVLMEPAGIFYNFVNELGAVPASAPAPGATDE